VVPRIKVLAPLLEKGFEELTNGIQGPLGYRGDRARASLDVAPRDVEEEVQPTSWISGVVDHWVQ
jgi:hypothetical protein